MSSDSYKEKIPHGDALFPMAVHVTPASGPGRERLYCHWHEEMEFLVVTEGGAEFHIGTRSHRMYAGEALFIRPHQLHSATAIGTLPSAFFAVVISPSLMQSYTDDLIQQKYIDPVLCAKRIFPEELKGNSDWDSGVLERLFQIRNLFLRKDTGYEMLIKACMFEIWHLMTLHSVSPDSAPYKNDDYQVAKIKSILNYMHQNYGRAVTSREISTHFHMSEGYFCRLFKETVKMSATNYLNYYRICKSLPLIRQNDRKLSDTAGLVGFNNTSYFNKVFRKFMHCSPSEFKRNAAQKNGG